MSLERLTRQALALILLTASLQLALSARGPEKKSSVASPSIVVDTTKYRTGTYLDWADARENLVPALRSVSFFYGLGQGNFVTRPFAPFLLEALVVDRPSSM